MSTEYIIEGERSPRGNLITGWPTDAGPHQRLVDALADELEEEMTSDRSLQRVIVTVEVVELGARAADPMSSAPPTSQGTR